MKWVVTFSLSSIYICTSQNKPFNPLLGETNQGIFSDGTRFYCEHTSHHPPISHYLLEGPDDSYSMSGYYEFIGKMGTNSLTSGLRGPTKLEFKDGTVIRFNAPDFKLGGTVMGERTIECVGCLVFQDIKNSLKAVVQLGTYKESGFWTTTKSGSKSGVEGIIYRVSKKDNLAVKFGKNQTLPEDLTKVKDIDKKICDISGSWLEKICFGPNQYWNIDRDMPFR